MVRFGNVVERTAALASPDSVRRSEWLDSEHYAVA